MHDVVAKHYVPSPRTHRYLPPCPPPSRARHMSLNCASSKAAANARRKGPSKAKTKVDAGKGNSGTVSSALRSHGPLVGGGIAGWGVGAGGGGGKDGAGGGGGSATSLAAAAAKAEEKRR